eukprot:CAMPEP_0181511626 /NCGR_PEP_ID=MMETSP1110-20121109/61533_1 /TAXON_ID=174948 /ORGANISM="Symbiodinium sp., Strain CCMP421" /LENGTH=104 /DNA_ID=CAMNT_0023641373 /DNA_START=84 /DNA_END=398 /DNA_ORIENTATION=+
MVVFNGLVQLPLQLQGKGHARQSSPALRLQPQARAESLQSSGMKATLEEGVAQVHVQGLLRITRQADCPLEQLTRLLVAVLVVSHDTKLVVDVGVGGHEGPSKF